MSYIMKAWSRRERVLVHLLLLIAVVLGLLSLVLHLGLFPSESLLMERDIVLLNARGSAFFFVFWLLISLAQRNFHFRFFGGFLKYLKHLKYPITFVRRFDPIRRAVLVATLTFIFSIIVAFPSVYIEYNEYRSIRGSPYRTFKYAYVKPIWGQRQGVFNDINLSVLLCEFLGSCTLGLLVWVFSGKTIVPLPGEEKSDLANSKADQPDHYGKG